MNTVLTSALTGDSDSCAAWCEFHDDENGVCLSSTAVVDVPDAPTAHISSFRGCLANSENGTSLMFGLDAYWFETNLDAAERIGKALLGLVATARDGGAR